MGLEAARQWYEAETGLDVFNPSSARRGGDAHLTEFYPDWESGEMVTARDGSQIVVTRLWRDAEATYDSRVSFLRVLAVYLAADGSVDKASILNFVSPNPIAEDDGPALVAALADGTIHQRDVAVTDHTVQYEMRSARRYMPDGSVLDIDVSQVETSDPASLQGRGDGSGSSRLAIRYVCVVSSVQYRVDVGTREGVWQTDTWADCTRTGQEDTGGGDSGHSGGSGGSGGSGSGDGNGESTTQRENRLLDQLSDDPYALLDVPCDEIEEWLTVGTHEPSDAIIDRLAEIQRNEYLINRVLPNEWHVQDIRDARGAQINMDYFAVRITLPPGTSSSSFFESFRQNLHNCLDTNISSFRPYRGESDRWNRGPVFGTVGHFDVHAFGWGSSADQFEDVSVIVSEYDPGRMWKFTTLWSPGDGYHPVSGTREFGITPNGDGSFNLYTRGVDRISTFPGAMAGIALQEDGVPLQFIGSDDLWKSMQRYVEYEINSMPGGSATVIPPTIHRPDWDAFRGYFDETVTLDELLESIDCEEAQERRRA